MTTRGHTRKYTTNAVMTSRFPIRHRATHRVFALDSMVLREAHIVFYYYDLAGPCHPPVFWLADGFVGLTVFWAVGESLRTGSSCCLNRLVVLSS